MLVSDFVWKLKKLQHQKLGHSKKVMWPSKPIEFVLLPNDEN